MGHGDGDPRVLLYADDEGAVVMASILKNRNIQRIIICSLIACVLHATMLHTPFNDYLYTSIFKVFMFILAPFMYCKIAKDAAFTDLLSLFKMRGRKNMLIAFALGFGTFAFIIIVFTLLLPFFDRAVIVDALAENGITPYNAIFVFLYIVIINAALEQFFFRGFVFVQMYQIGFKRFAHGYSSVLFSFYHIPILFNGLSVEMLIFCTVGLIIAGLIFNTLAVIFKSISGSLIVHISANLALNLMIGWHFVF